LTLLLKILLQLAKDATADFNLGIMGLLKPFP
jgi:hypothetical protein